jgi:hypothetical protein
MQVQKTLKVPAERSVASAVFTSLCEEDNMRKFAFTLAALGAMAVALPSIASAQTVVIKRGGHHHGWYGARAQMHHDRGWHRHHHDRVVVIKKRYHRY